MNSINLPDSLVRPAVAILGFACLSAVSGCATRVVSRVDSAAHLITAAELPADSSAPRVVRAVSPEFPSEMKRGGIEGEVRLMCLIGAEGRVQHVAVLDASAHQFIEPALRVLHDWKFTPGVRAGQPVAMSIMVPMRFVFADPAGEPKAPVGLAATF
jgi:TonB family protein